MTSEQRDPGAGPEPGSEASEPGTPSVEPGTPSGQPAGAAPPTFEQRMETFGRDASAAGERFGHEAEATAQRLSRDPAVSGAFSAAGVAFGLVVLAVGLWLFADITLGMSLPRIPWRDLWPLALIFIGLAVLFRGVMRRA